MKKINTLNSVIQTTEGRKNLGITQSMLPRSFAPLWMTVMMVLAFTACSEEDLVQPTNGEAGTLHITSVSVDGQQVGGRSRAVADDETQYDYENAPYNQSLNSFGNGDKIKLSYNFGGAGDDAPAPVYATFNDGVWTIDGNIAPRAEEESETWGLLDMTATANAYKELIGDPEEEEEEDDDIYDECADGGEEESEYAAAARVLGIVAGEGIESANIRLLTDFLYATIADGSISIDKNLTSPTLGATTISFKHASRALLCLPQSAVSIDTENSYVVGGQKYSVTGLATLWAVVKDGENTYYYPLTAVGNNWQAIVYSGVSLVGFKAVLYATEVAAENTPMESSTGSEPSTITLDLPFKVGGSASTGIVLEENTQYPLTLTLRPNQAQVNLASATGKPGWAVDVQEHEFDNSENEFELKYIAGENGAAGTFIVKTPQALQNLNLWMVGTKSTADFKALGYAGCGDIADDISNANRYAQNITLAADITLPTVGEGESNWTPIGNSSNIYSGVFDGNNKTIKNLTIVDGTLSHIGLIGALSNTGKVKDVNLENVLIDSRSRETYPLNKIGGIVGYSYADTDDDAEVSGCTVSGKIWGGGFSCVGGIVGCTENGNFIRDCTLVAGSELDAKDPVGGIVGAMGTNCKVYNCNVSSDIKIGSYKSGTAGGIVGRAGNGTLIEKCETAEGSEVKGNMRVAGILADSNSSSTNTCKVIDCINRSNVRLDMETSYEEYIGGIVADGNNIDITNCTNYGALTSDDAVYMGGIIGKGPSCKLENCTNMETATLTVTSKTPDQFTRLGGIIGYARYLVQVKGCMNHAAITHTYNSSQNYIGGIVGEMYNYDNGDGFVACGNTGSITLQKMDDITYSSLYVGGIAGTNNDTDCKYRGCWTRDVDEHYCSMTAVQTQKDGFGYVYSTNSASSIINSYTASAKTEGTDQAFINGKVDEMNDDIRSYGWQWVADKSTNPDWPTLQKKVNTNN